MRIETVQSLVNSLNAVSKEKHRYALNHVLVEKNGIGDSIKITVTDGHYLTQVVLEDSLAGHLPSKGVLIHKDEVEKLKALKLKKVESFKVDGCNWEINGLKISVHFVNGESHLSFPDYSVLIPKTELDFKVSLNVEYLESILKSIRESSKEKSVILCFNPENNMSPILIKRCAESDNFGILMPRKI